MHCRERCVTTAGLVSGWHRFRRWISSCRRRHHGQCIRLGCELDEVRWVHVSWRHSARIGFIVCRRRRCPDEPPEHRIFCHYGRRIVDERRRASDGRTVGVRGHFWRQCSVYIRYCDFRRGHQCRWTGEYRLVSISQRIFYADRCRITIGGGTIRQQRLCARRFSTGLDTVGPWIGGVGIGLVCSWDSAGRRIHHGCSRRHNRWRAVCRGCDYFVRALLYTGDCCCRQWPVSARCHSVRIFAFRVVTSMLRILSLCSRRHRMRGANAVWWRCGVVFGHVISWEDHPVVGIVSEEGSESWRLDICPF